MQIDKNKPLVQSIKQKCRMCYTCVRECPVKAIQIVNGQANVIAERCIGCGNCVKVCSQNAKKILDGIEDTKFALDSQGPCAAIVAPSFPAAFFDLAPLVFVGMIRALGFDYVHEVAFGAELVARAYRELLEKYPNNRFIATTCPSTIAYVERFAPNMIKFLAPIVSPMIATTRALRAIHGQSLKIVFIGPCISKKGEKDASATNKMNGVLTFHELNLLFKEKNIHPHHVKPQEFDPPLVKKGTVFPLAHGLLETAGLPSSLFNDDIQSMDGLQNALEAIQEFERGVLKARLLDVLCCKGGCIMGAGVSHCAPLFQRRSAVSAYARARLANNPLQDSEMNEDALYPKINFNRTFINADQRRPNPSDAKIQDVLEKMGKYAAEDELNCGACGYASCREHAIAIIKGLAEIEMCLPYDIDQLQKTVKELEKSHEQLASTQQALMQAEKLASMGQMAAGIAHEVNNPLGTVLLYSHLLSERTELMQNPALLSDIDMIVSQADRCKKILSGLLNFARQNKVLTQTVQLPDLIQDIIYQANLPKTVTASITNQLAASEIELDPDQITQALINIISNAVYAMNDEGGLTIRLEDEPDRLFISICDTGTGIPEHVMPRLFEPFFTTKQMGKGTGLGLSVTYGIIKMHHGDIHVQTNSDSNKAPTGTTFRITLPRRMQYTSERT